MQLLGYFEKIFNAAVNTEIYSNTVAEYFTALIILAIALVSMYILRKIIRTILNRIINNLDSSLIARILQGEKKLTPILQYIPFYLITEYLIVPSIIKTAINSAGIVIITICVIRYFIHITKLVSREYIDSSSSTLLQGSIDFFADFILWVMAALFILSNLGFNINTLLAGVGIGGMAVALASQTLLGDLFNYFTILIDKPFKLGDYVTLNGQSGTIQKIGLKGTRLISVDGQQLIISNTDMTKNILQNFQTMEKRRNVAILGVQYDTNTEVVKQIPALLQDIVSSVPGTEFARAHFATFADSSLNFELVYYVYGNNYTIYMDNVQQVNFKILDEFAKRGINFAFPSQSVYMQTPVHTVAKQQI